jgi:hypothetical protein
MPLAKELLRPSVTGAPSKSSAALYAATLSVSEDAVSFVAEKDTRKKTAAHKIVVRSRLAIF